MSLNGQQHINIGQPNQSESSDSLYTAFTKIEDNFDVVFANGSSYTEFVPATVPVGSNVGIEIAYPSNSSVSFLNTGVTSLTAVGNNVFLNRNNGDIQISVTGGGGGGGGISNISFNSTTLNISGSPVIPPSGNVNINLATVPNLVAATYSSPTVQVDTTGRVVAIANGTAGTVTSVNITGNTGISVTQTGVPGINPAFDITNTGVTRITTGGGIVVSGDGTGVVTLTATGGGNGGGSGSVTRVGILPGSTNLSVTGVPGGNIVTAGTFTLDVSQILNISSLTSNTVTANSGLINNNFQVNGNSNVANINSTSTISAAANVIANNFTANANATVTNTLTSANIIVGNATLDNITVGNISTTNSVIIGNQLQVNSTSTMQGIIVSSNTTAATSTTTGAITTPGGVGIGGAAYIGGNIVSGGAVNVLINTPSTSTATGALTVVGGAGIVGNTYIGGIANVGQLVVNGVSKFFQQANISNVTDSFSPTTGALIVSGGVGIASNLFVGGDFNVAGAGTFQGNLTVVGNLSPGNLTTTGNITANNIISSSYSSSNTITITASGGNLNLVASQITNLSGNVTYTGTPTTATTLAGNVNIGVFGNATYGLSVLGNGPNSIATNGGANITGPLYVGGTTNLQGTTIINGALNAISTVTISGITNLANSVIIGTAGNTTQSLTILSTSTTSINASGGASFAGNLAVTGTANIVGNTVLGNTQVGNPGAGNSKTFTQFGNMSVVGTMTLGAAGTPGDFNTNGNLIISGNNFIFGDSSTQNDRLFSMELVAPFTSYQFIMGANLAVGPYPNQAVAYYLLGANTTTANTYQYSVSNMEFQSNIGGVTSTVITVRNNGTLRLTPLAVNPATPTSGDTYYSSTSNQMFVYDGTAFRPISDFVGVPATSAAPGFAGQISANTTNMFIHNGTTWRTVATTAF